ncbi:MAG: copper homeostasis protein CutC [Bacteroidales bacterium]|jgi:copper homeostasis protein|nr:copper homeostasis protein CutC [Bacteroidales bacterium]
MRKRIIEICANSAQSCVEAEAGGATRVELCAGIPEGGTTPSYGEIYTARTWAVNIAIHIIIRPRGGDFIYSAIETDSMLYDIEMAHRLDIQGVVFGCLTPRGDLDTILMKKLVNAAKPLSITFHRAFDICRDPFTVLEQLIDLGCNRILTSGQEADAVQGIPLITELIRRADNRIIIMPGCGINKDNIDLIERETGAVEFHASARSVHDSLMIHQNTRVMMESKMDLSDFKRVETSRIKVKDLVNAEN